VLHAVNMLGFFSLSSCHLQLGEVEDALHYFNKCLESRIGVCLDRRITIEAADGVQKAQVCIY
jgi:DnaJ family protein C protein 7